MNGIFVHRGIPSATELESLNRQTHQWECDAAKGLTGWICADCGVSFPEGMPTQCLHGDQRCTDIMSSFDR